MNKSLRKKILSKFLNYLVSNNKIGSYEQIREGFLNLRNKVLCFFMKNKEKIEFLFDFLNKKSDEEKESQTELRDFYTKEKKTINMHNEYKCKKCKVVFYHYEKLTEHLSTHLKAFKCNLCSKHYTRRSYLNLHTKKMHQNNLK